MSTKHAMNNLMVAMYDLDHCPDASRANYQNEVIKCKRQLVEAMLETKGSSNDVVDNGNNGSFREAVRQGMNKFISGFRGLVKRVQNDTNKHVVSQFDSKAAFNHAYKQLSFSGRVSYFFRVLGLIIEVWRRSLFNNHPTGSALAKADQDNENYSKALKPVKSGRSKEAQAVMDKYRQDTKIVKPNNHGLFSSFRRPGISKDGQSPKPGQK